MNRFPSKMILSGLLLAACSNQQNLSKLKYAHSPSPLLMGTPYGQLELLNAGFKNNFGDTFRVCVEGGKKSMSDGELILETKLAYASWLQAAGYGTKDFEKFSFEIQTKCKRKDAQFAGTIVLADKANEDADDGFEKLFVEPKISCTSSGRMFSCQDVNGSITLGWGRSATIQHQYFTSNPEKWVGVNRVDPAFVVLNPYVEWMNLSEGIAQNEGLAGDVKVAVAKTYLDLLNAEKQSFTNLVAFAKLLTESKAITAKDQKFQKLFDGFLESGDPVTNQPYKPQMAAFHTLLHEVGHTFGMMHADNPKADSITGSSGTAVLDAETNQYKTSISTMAYAENYTFLTEDDVIGVASAAKSALKEVAKHK